MFKSLLRYIKSLYKEQFYQHSRLRERFFRFTNVNYDELIARYVEEVFPQSVIQSFNEARKRDGMELLT